MKIGQLPRFIYTARFMENFYKPIAHKINALDGGTFADKPNTAFSQAKYTFTHYDEVLQVCVLEVDLSTIPEGFTIEGIEDRSDSF